MVSGELITRFSFYFPPKEQYQGRFFQYITPVPDNENLSQGAIGEGDKIGFSIASGAYFIETNGGGKAAQTRLRGRCHDWRLPGANAAAAAPIRGWWWPNNSAGGRPYGYAFGGSGGAYRTIGSIENTQGVWDGVVPYVVGSPMALPNVFTVRMHAMRVLQHKFPQIADALEPGGSGDMYAGPQYRRTGSAPRSDKNGLSTQSVVQLPADGHSCVYGDLSRYAHRGQKIFR